MNTLKSVRVTDAVRKSRILNLSKFAVAVAGISLLYSGSALGQENIMEQNELLARAEHFNPHVSGWLKPEPGLAYRIPKDLKDIPRVIYNNVGTIDDINKWIEKEEDKFKSLDEYFTKMAGSVINLQYANGKLDFYAIGSNVWKNEYVEVPVQEAKEGNKKLVTNLEKDADLASLLASNDPNLIGVKKLPTIFFVRASALGIPLSQTFTVPKPEWGAGQSQTKPANEDSFVRFEVNKGSDGSISISSYIVGAVAVRLQTGEIVSRPIAYVPPAEFKIWLDKHDGHAPSMPEKLVGRSGADEFGIQRTPELYGYLHEDTRTQTIVEFLSAEVAKKSKNSKTLTQVIDALDCRGILGAGKK